MLLRGDRLPATRSRTFKLDDSARRFVSLDLYEELRECRLDGVGAGGWGCGVAYWEHYSYHLLSTVDVPAPWTGQTGGGEVSVCFAVDVGGVLTFQVLPANPNPAGESGDTGAWAGSEALLLLCILLLLVTYAAVKVAMPLGVEDKSTCQGGGVPGLPEGSSYS